MVPIFRNHLPLTTIPHHYSVTPDNSQSSFSCDIRQIVINRTINAVNVRFRTRILDSLTKAVFIYITNSSKCQEILSKMWYNIFSQLCYGCKRFSTICKNR